MPTEVQIYKDGTVVAADIADKTITATQIADKTITAAQIADNGVAYSNIASGVILATNTVALFYQATAPTGWTRIDTHNNKALRVVSGTGPTGGGQGSSTGGGSGNDTGRNFTSAFASTRTVPLVDHSHSVSDPGHRHPYAFAQGTGTAINNGYNGISSVVYQGNVAELEQSGGNDGQRLAAFTANTAPATTGVIVNNASSGTNAGGTQTTGNTMDFAVQYIDVLLCSKA
jgi:hypothetical protein